MFAFAPARSFAAFALMSALVMPVASFGAADSGTSASDEAPKCPQGKVWDKKKEKCVVAESSLGNDALYDAGRQLAKAGEFEQAIRVLVLAPNKNDPRVLNYLGYSHRKAGRVTVGLGYYQEALRIDPDYVLVREYLGEAYLMLGDAASARGQLTEIGKRCGTACAEYAELARQIDAFEKANS